NAHVHLDLTGMHSLAPPSPDFTGWLRQVIAHRRGRSAEQVRADMEAGLAEGPRFGTTLLRDARGDGGSWDLLANALLRAVVFREMLGRPTERAKQAWLDMLSWRRGLSPSATCRPGLSPHAPYSVNAGLIRSIAWNGWVMTIHLAESLAELELLEHRSG